MSANLPFSPQPLPSQQQQQQQQRIFVLVIAHPDDESMFFLPFINHVRHLKQQLYHRNQQIGAPSPPPLLWVVCLTTGDYNGLGTIRVQELKNVATTLFQHNPNNRHTTATTTTSVFDDVIIIDEPNIMPDHPTKAWSIQSTSQLLRRTLEQALVRHHHQQNQNQSTQTKATHIRLHLITFDEYGVSGHVNHRDTYYTVRQLLYEHQQLQQQHLSRPEESRESAERSEKDNETALWQNTKLDVWTLQSIRNPLIKYIPLVEWIRLLIYWTRRYCYSYWSDGDRTETWDNAAVHGNNLGMFLVDSNDEKKATTAVVCHMYQPSWNWHAMSTHQSQFVWYRRLFVVFSCYTYCNIFHRLLLPQSSSSSTATKSVNTTTTTTTTATTPNNRTKQA